MRSLSDVPIAAIVGNGNRFARATLVNIGTNLFCVFVNQDTPFRSMVVSLQNRKRWEKPQYSMKLIRKGWNFLMTMPSSSWT